MARTSTQRKQKRPYVYTLAYPESMGGQIFYVGRGTGHRINAHEREARKGETCNPRKVDIIRAIWNHGEQVVRNKVAFFDTDEEAALYEMTLILSLSGLTNLTAGGEGRTRGPTQKTIGDIPLQQLLDNTAITVSQLSRRANVDYRTAKKAVEGTGPVQRVKALALLRVINELLGTSYRPEDIDGLEID
ncbi:MAG TPA: GIY-YIG nuclease family protein [Ktedonobacteraceae bacterium]|nr:GIY-YIG nuclease family protein [Ktedonobacteraceae bacterium]